MSASAQTYRSFAEFYPFYLGEHSRRTTRRLHFLGSSLGLGCLMLLVLSGNLWWLAGALVSGYAFAWFSHYAVEKTAQPPSANRFTVSWATGRCSGRC